MKFIYNVAKLKEIIRINKVERSIWCIIFHKALTVKFFLKEPSFMAPRESPIVFPFPGSTQAVFFFQ